MDIALLLLFVVLILGLRAGAAGKYRPVLAHALRWALGLGALGFGLGFFGPILLTPEANQGPLLGIFITGPLGFLLGLLWGAWRGWPRAGS
jgi:hypothetical protein